jgi:hypothetical protein
VENYSVTPFGVLEDEAGAYKSFDDESFWEEVLSPSEKEALRKNKEGFLADPDSVVSEPVEASLKFYPWKKPVISSGGRIDSALQLLVSNTWALNKEAIPDFLRLLEKLRDKYMDVLGDSKLMSLLEEAEHRAHELQLSSDEDGEAGGGVNSSTVFSHGGSGMCTGAHPISIGVLQDSDGNDIEPFEMYFEDEFGVFAKVENQSKKRGFFSSAGGKMSGVKRKIMSAPEGVNQQAYDEYVQQLVAKGIPEDQARQLADNLVESMRQDAANFASNVQGGQPGSGMSGVVSSREGGMGKSWVKSDGDVIVHQDDDKDEKDSKSGFGDGSDDDDLGLGDLGEDDDDLGLGDLGEDQPGEDLGGGVDDDQPVELEDGFMDEVNSIEDFGANEPALSQEEVVDALEAISQIADTVLEVEGESGDTSLTSDEESFVLDQVDDLAASFGGDVAADDAVSAGADFDFESGGDETFEADAKEDEELNDLENIGAGLVRVVVAGEPERRPAFSGVYVTKEKFAGKDAVVCSGVNSGRSLILDGEADDSILDTFVCSSQVDIDNNTPITTGYLKASAFKRWVKQSRGHRLAWRAAINQVARRLGHRPRELPEMASVLAIASSIHDKWFNGKAKANNAKKVLSALSGKKAAHVRRVGAALQKRVSEGKSMKVIKSDYNGFRNYVTWNVAVYLKQNANFRDKARAFLKSNRGAGYDQLIKGIGLAGHKTPDNVDWLDSRIDRKEMGKVLSFLSNSFRGSDMQGLLGVRSSTQVGGNNDEVVTVQEETKTGLGESGRTLSSEEIEGENSARLTGVDGGDTSRIVNVNNTGDDGSLEADIDAGAEFNGSGYSFDSSKIAAIELPIEGEDATQTLEMREIGSGVYILRQAYVSPGAGRCSFTKGREAKAVLSRARPSKSIKANVNRVITLKGSKNALLLRSSSVLGVVGVEAPFSKGLKNSKYSVFSRTGVNLVNEDGYYFSSPKGPQRVIASAVSNKSVRQGKERHNVIADVEQDYIQYLRASVARVYNDNRVLKLRLDKAMKAQEGRANIQSKLLEREQRKHRKEMLSSVADLQALRVKAASEDSQRVFGSSQEAIRREQEHIKSQAEKNIEYLASLM